MVTSTEGVSTDREGVCDNVSIPLFFSLPHSEFMHVDRLTSMGRPISFAREASHADLSRRDASAAA
jgi:hypothetical protein